MKLRVVDRRSGGDWEPPANFRAALDTICAEAGSREWTVDLVLVDDEIMVSLNEGFRESCGVTDVLSFSYLAQAGSAAPDLGVGERYASCDLWRDNLAGGGEAAVGEIILAPGFIGDRCRREGWPFADEIALLVAHGVLHVLGWEHGDVAAVEAMRDAESTLLALVGTIHPLRGEGA